MQKQTTECKRRITTVTHDGRRQAVAPPAQQRSQVISRSEHILEPGHPDALFSSKKLTTFFSRRPQNTKAANAAENVSLSK